MIPASRAVGAGDPPWRESDYRPRSSAQVNSALLERGAGREVVDAAQPGDAGWEDEDVIEVESVAGGRPIGVGAEAEPPVRRWGQAAFQQFEAWPSCGLATFARRWPAGLQAG